MTISGDYGSAVSDLETLQTAIETALDGYGTHPDDAEPNTVTPDASTSGVEAQTLSQAAINVATALAALRESDSDRTANKLDTLNL